MPKLEIVDEMTLLIDDVNAGQPIDAVVNHKHLAPDIQKAFIAFCKRKAKDQADALETERTVMQKAMRNDADKAREKMEADHAAECAKHQGIIEDRDAEIADLKAKLKEVTEQRDALGTTEQALEQKRKLRKAVLEKQMADLAAERAKLEDLKPDQSTSS